MSELSKALIELDQLISAYARLTPNRPRIAAPDYDACYRAMTRDINQAESRIARLAREAT